jgi:hypothetical protein
MSAFGLIDAALQLEMYALGIGGQVSGGRERPLLTEADIMRRAVTRNAK